MNIFDIHDITDIKIEIGDIICDTGDSSPLIVAKIEKYDSSKHLSLLCYKQAKINPNFYIYIGEEPTEWEIPENVAILIKKGPLNEFNR